MSDYTTPQIAAISSALRSARNSNENTRYYIGNAQEELPGLDRYVKGLEDANAAYQQQLLRLRDELAKLRKRV